MHGKRRHSFILFLEQASDDHFALFSGEGRGGFVGGKLARCLAAATRTPARQPVPAIMIRANTRENGARYNRSAQILQKARSGSIDRVVAEVSKLSESAKQLEADTLWHLWTQPRCSMSGSGYMGGSVRNRGRPEVAGLVLSLCLAPNGRTFLHGAWVGNCRFAILRRTGHGPENCWFRCQALSGTWPAMGPSGKNLLNLDQIPCNPLLLQVDVEDGDLLVAGSPGFWQRMGPCDDARLAAQLMTVVNQHGQQQSHKTGEEQEDVVVVGRRLRDHVLRCSRCDVTLFVTRISRGAGCIASADVTKCADSGMGAAGIEGAKHVKEWAALSEGKEELGPDCLIKETNSF